MGIIDPPLPRVVQDGQAEAEFDTNKMTKPASKALAGEKTRRSRAFTKFASTHPLR